MVEELADKASMAGPISSPNFLCSPTLSLSYRRPHAPPLLPVAPPLNRCIRAPGALRRRWKSRGISVVTRAVPNSYIFALVLPISLLGVTIFTAVRVSDKLDQKFLEELAVEQSMLDSEDEDGGADTSPNKEIETPRRRSRPKREVETSSM